MIIINENKYHILQIKKKSFKYIITQYIIMMFGLFCNININVYEQHNLIYLIFYR